LRCIDYGEADRIVTLLTRRHGKLAALARSARRSKRRFAGALEGFALLDAELALGTGELAGLRSARVVRAFPRVLADLERMSVAGALLRLCRDLVPEHVADPDLFEELTGMFDLLDDVAVAPAVLHVAFEVRLLALTGFAPLLAACGRCGKRPAPERAADFDPQRGALVCQACGGASQRLHGPVRERLLAAMGGQVGAIARDAWRAEELREAKHALDTFVGHRLQRVPNA
jgi:DNA repair protein RecO (recombination protein O)